MLLSFPGAATSVMRSRDQCREPDLEIIEPGNLPKKKSLRGFSIGSEIYPRLQRPYSAYAEDEI